MSALWISVGEAQDWNTGKTVKIPGEVWLRNTRDYREQPRRVMLAKNFDSQTGAQMESLADYLATADDEFVSLEDPEFQVQDLTYEEAYAQLAGDNYPRAVNLNKFTVHAGGIGADTVDADTGLTYGVMTLVCTPGPRPRR